MATTTFRSKTISIDYRERAYFALMAIFAVALSTFLYYFGITMYDAAYVTSHQAKVSDFHASIADKEASYLGLANKLTIEKAHELGLVDVAPNNIIALAESSSALGMNSSVVESR